MFYEGNQNTVKNISKKLLLSKVKINYSQFSMAFFMELAEMQV